MDLQHELLYGLSAAFGGGVLIGIGRERSKYEGHSFGAIGVRSCVIASMIGAIAGILGDAAALVGGAGVIGLSVAAYLHSRRRHPTVVTQLALIVTFMLGVLSISRPQLAAALFVGAALVLAQKSALHGFATRVLTRDELDDALLLAASILIVMPLLPAAPMSSFGMLSPRALWLFVVMVMSINAAGYVALRAFGPSRGLPLSGFLGGFVSSAATIAGMAQRSRQNPALQASCIAGAMLSSVATVVQLAAILAAVSLELLRELARPLAAVGIVAVAASGVAIWSARRNPQSHDDRDLISGRPFSLRQALQFAAIVAATLLAATAFHRWLGAEGVIASAAAAGFADVHAAAIALGQQVRAGTLSATNAQFALVAAFATNSIMKCLASLAGGATFARVVIGAMVVMNVALAVGVYYK